MENKFKEFELKFVMDEYFAEQGKSVQQKSDGDYYEDEKKLNPLAQLDKYVQDLPKITGTANYKTTLGMAEKLIPVIYKDLNSGNFNNTARTFTMLGTALIPYGGAIITPLIGIIWKEDTSGQEAKLQKMMRELSDLMGKKIEDYDISKLKQKNEALLDVLKKFEDSVNNLPQDYSEVQEYSDTIQLANARYADMINVKFEELIKESSTPGYDVAELPVYTVIASAHLMFLKFMQENAVKHPRIQMDAEHYSRYFSRFEDVAVKYKNYIYGVWYRVYSSFHAQTGGHLRTESQLNFYTKIINLKAQTLDSDTFVIASNPTVDRSVTGFKKEKNKWFYYSPKNGFKNMNGRLFTQGQMVTGWVSVLSGGVYKTFYLCETDDEKNSAGEKFEKGEMFIGWYHGDEWYYMDSEGEMLNNSWKQIKDTATNVDHWYFFKLGGAMTRSENGVQISGKKYDFDANGVCTTPNGY
ncbi:insecticidal delta-endotoxin Cry8Ea1 family protein [Pseudomonas sp. RIT-PI-AD]|uniref:insecticidal delta-endotoxin Cry8Ea1 family protein n=1 Tax=Pseudomonas sp. RIT-PI-AD TaxID=3035294 RepID=UPI0021DA330E|nr:insecticidal delta-endotoxin Cry8Ea1 family protein [Pseudomonas sp. RIT-PI-AD]